MLILPVFADGESVVADFAAAAAAAAANGAAHAANAPCLFVLLRSFVRSSYRRETRMTLEKAR